MNIDIFNTYPLILITAAILLVIIGAVLGYIIITLIKRFLIVMRFRKGRKGETVALRYLKKHGFTILREQYTATSAISINHKPHDFEVRADFLVEKDGQTAIVEVKTGDAAGNPRNSLTRRQLFEYYHIYDTDLLYLFDADKKKLLEISFPD